MKHSQIDTNLLRELADRAKKRAGTKASSASKKEKESHALALKASAYAGVKPPQLQQHRSSSTPTLKNFHLFI